MKSLKSKLVAVVATIVMAIAGINPVAAQAAASPYNYNVLGTYTSPATELVAAGNRVYYKVGGQLWTSDGTTQLMVADFGATTSLTIGQEGPKTPAFDGAFTGDETYVNHSVVIGSKFYFWGYAGAWGLWVSDGTVAGTKPIGAPIFAVGSPTDWIVPSLFAGGSNIYFWSGWKGAGHGTNANLSVLYRVDVSQAVPSAQAITDNQNFWTNCYDDNWQGGFTAMQTNFAYLNGKVYFDYSNVYDGLCINHLGVYDPSASPGSNVTQLGTIGYSDTYGYHQMNVAGPQKFVVFNNRVYFYAQLSSNQVEAELWSTDGTDAGTKPVAEVGTVFGGVGLRNDTYMRPTVVGNYLYFAGISPANNNYTEIFRTDGTTVERWITSETLYGPGKRSNTSATVLGAGANAKLIIDGQANGKTMHNWEMNAVDLTAKTATRLIDTLDNNYGGIGCTTVCNSSVLANLQETSTWDGKAWWVAVDSFDNDGGIAKARDVYYSDGTPSGTSKLTANDVVYQNSNDDGNFTIGYQGSSFDAATTAGWGQIPGDAWATRPLVVANDRVFYLSGNGKNATSWTLNSITRASTPIVCGSVMSKLKLEAESASDLTPKFATATCEYNISVDYKTTKMDITPTFSPSAATVLVDGVSKTTTLKSTKTQTVTLGAAGTRTVVDIVFGSNTYRITVTRKAPPTAGGRDPQFTPPVILGGVVKSVALGTKVVQKNGKSTKVQQTVVGGTFDGKVKKLDENGKEDDEFTTKLPTIAGTVNKVEVDDESRVIVAGKNVKDGDKDEDVIRLKNNGEKDNSFKSHGNTGGDNSEVKDVQIQKDGKVVVAGDLDNGEKNVVRLKEDGSKDTVFNANVPSFNGPVNTVKIQDDGKILVGGSFTNVGGDPSKDNIVRLEKDGKLDNSFDPGDNGSHFNDEVKDIETSKDGKIVVVGKSDKNSDENEADHVARLKEDGHEDPTFNHAPDLSPTEVINTVKVKDNGEIFIGGSFQNVGDGDGDNIAKLKKDGEPDVTWNPPAQGGAVNDLEIGEKGKLTLAGDGDPNDAEHDDKMDQLQDNDPSKPRYDKIDDERSVNNVPTGTAGQTVIHGDGFTPDTTVTIGGQIATVVSVDERGEELTIQVPKPDNEHKGDKTHEPKPADLVISVPGDDPITVPEAFGYTDIKEPQVIKPKGDHINSDKDDEDHKGKVNDDENLSAWIPSDEPITHTSITPDICTVDENNQVHYEHRGDCKIVTDAPGNMGYTDPAPVTEVVPVAGLDPLLAPPTLPDFSGTTNDVPDTGFQLPPASAAVPEIPVVFVSKTPDVCDVSATGLVTPIDITQDCTVAVTTPGDPIYEPTAPTDPPVTVVIPAAAWLPPVPDQVTGIITDPATNISLPGGGGTISNGDVSFTYNKAKGTLTPAASGIYFGPIKATINYSWTRANSTTGTGTCVITWGVLKKWSKLSKADQKKYKKPLAMKSFTTTKGCAVNAAAKAALAVPGTTFTASSDVLRTRMWPATYLPKKPNNERIAPRLRHLTITINTN